MVAVVANPSAGTGSYTITLAANSISAGTGYRAGPTSAVASTAVYYAQPLPIISVLSFTAPTSSTSNRITSSRSTFVLTLNAAIPKTELTSSDFSLSTTQLNIPSIRSVTGRGSGTTASIYDIVINNPSMGSGDYLYYLEANSISAGTGYRACLLYTSPSPRD